MLLALLAAAALGLFVIWTRGRPERSLYAAVFATGFLMTPSLPVVREKFAAPEVCMLLTWALIAVRARPKGWPMLGVQKRVLLVGAAFTAFAILSWAINQSAAPQAFVGSTVEVLNYAYGFMVMATVVHLVDRWEVLENVLWAWLAAAVVVSGVGVLAVAGAAPAWALDDFTGRVSATLKFSNQVPSFLLPILPVAVVLAVVRPQQFRRRLLLAALALAGIGTLAMTGSRTGLLMVALLLVGILWVALTEGNRPRLHSGLITASFAALVALQIGISTFALATYDGNYALGRTPTWQRPTVTLYEWLTAQERSLETLHPSRARQVSFVVENAPDYALFGIGPKMVGARFGMAEIHNTYLGVLIETGFIGTALFLAMVGLVAHTGWRAMRRCGPDVQRAVIRALLVGLALLLFYQATMFGLRQRNLWIIMGIIVALPRALRASGLLRSSVRPIAHGVQPAE